MDPPLPAPLFSFSPPSPNHSYLQNPNPDPGTADLPTMISLLKDLAARADSTLKSVSDFFSSGLKDTALILCPHDPRHRVPPESLFRHSLRCPSAPGAALPDLDFLHSLHYPSSLRPESELQSENPFLRPPPESDADLCFSLDGEPGESATNFFYRNCPGVVSFPEQDVGGTSRTFTLPAFLSAECANFVSKENSTVLAVRSFRIFPSEFWALRGEVESWMDYPASYSYTVLWVASCLHRAEWSGFKKWMISNSPRYGILIDSAMGDHLFLLLKLCLKAIQREACVSLELVLSKDGNIDPKSFSFNCPRLVGSLMWLVSQLSVLYGEASGKFFTVGMLKESLLQAGSSLMLFRSGREEVKEDDFGHVDGGVADRGSQIFVSQVAAAVAALHERFLLEEKIRALRFGWQIPRTQRINEHLYFSTRASEQRKKRPNYRPLIEHDGLLFHQVANQDLSKVKTREELLAEERDYKRRRMSYRGKTAKRTPAQVVRDIIEEHMEEIKQAGGIGCNVKVAADTAVPPADWNSQSDMLTSYTHELRSSSRYEPYEARLGSPSHRKQPRAECKVTSRTDKDDSGIDGSGMRDDLQNAHQKLRYECSEFQKDRKNSRHEREKSYGSRSFVKSSNAQHRERYSYQREEGDMRVPKTESDRNDSGYSPRPKGYSSRSALTFKSTKDFILENRSRKRSKTLESRRSESVTQDAFEDRYDPSDSYDGYDTTSNGVSVGSNYIRPDKFHNPTNVYKYDDALQRHDPDKKRQQVY